MGYTFPDTINPVPDFEPAFDGLEIREFFGLELPEQSLSLSDWQTHYPDLLLELRNTSQAQNAVKLFDSVKAPDPEAQAFEWAIEVNRHRLPGNLLEQAFKLRNKLASHNGFVLPPEWLYIGHTKWDDLLFIATSEEHEGKVYLLNAQDDYFSQFYESYFDAHGQMVDPQQHLIAHDLESLLAGGVPRPDEEE